MRLPNVNGRISVLAIHSLPAEALASQNPGAAIGTLWGSPNFALKLLRGAVGFSGLEMHAKPPHAPWRPRQCSVRPQ